MDEFIPSARRDLEFLPVRLQGKQYVLIRDHLGLVQEGKAVEIPLYQFMVLLDGTTTTRDLQMALMRQRGGMLVSSDEVSGQLCRRCFFRAKATFALSSASGGFIRLRHRQRRLFSRPEFRRRAPRNERADDVCSGNKMPTCLQDAGAWSCVVRRTIAAISPRL